MKKLNFLITIFCFMISSFVMAQTSTEMFETESNGSTSFTDNGVIFNIISHVGTFDIQANYPGTGWSGTANDNRYIDNSNSTDSPASFSIKTTSNLFKVNRFWIFLSALNLDLTVAGSLTITGKLSGVTKFTQTKTNGFATSITPTNGFTLIDMTNLNGQNYSNIIIDQLQITLGGGYRYASFDAFTWVKDSGVVLSDFQVSAGNQTNVSCNGGANGSATVNVSGGTTPYTYSWSPSGGSGATANGLAAGTYTVTVKDAQNTTKSQAFTITQPAVLTATVSSTDATCGNTNGTATAVAGGGTAPYTYSWAPTGGSAALANNLSAGTYTVTITDAKGCITTGSATIANTSGNTSAPGINLTFTIGSTLSSFNLSGQGIKWYATESNAIAHTNPLPGSTPIMNSTTYYATQTINGCESKTPLVINAYDATLFVSDTSKKSQITLYPNPVKEILNLDSESKINKVIISDYSGRKVMEKVLNGEHKIDVHSLVKGTYMIQIFVDNDVKMIKFIKD